MKFLGWMHSKFQHKIDEPFKDFSIGNSCGCLTGQPFLDEQQYPPLSNICNKPYIKGHKDNIEFKKQNIMASPDHEVAAKSDIDAEYSEIFHGFLAIGTLGTNPAIYDDPSTTPTFFISVDKIMEKETQVTEDDVKLINDELEKALGYDEISNLSSGRNSHVSSTGRSSHGSTITLCSKARESTENSISCPLKSYLLGSSMGYQETTSTNSSSNYKEHKKVSVSLGELFQKKKSLEEGEDFSFRNGINENKTVKKTDKSAAFLLKNILKRNNNHASSTRSSAIQQPSAGTPDSISSEKKLPKILQIFNKKVHPESSTAAKKKPIKSKLGFKSDTKASDNEMAHQCSGPLNENIQIQNSPSNTAQNEIIGNSSSWTGPSEHWIKSDSDFVVLEL